MVSAQPLSICGDCGRRYGLHPERAVCITISPGTCKVCGKPRKTSPAYDFGGLREGWEAEEEARLSSACEGMGADISSDVTEKQ